MLCSMQAGPSGESLGSSQEQEREAAAHPGTECCRLSAVLRVSAPSHLPPPLLDRTRGHPGTHSDRRESGTGRGDTAACKHWPWKTGISLFNDQIDPKDRQFHFTISSGEGFWVTFVMPVCLRLFNRKVKFTDGSTTKKIIISSYFLC